MDGLWRGAGEEGGAGICRCAMVGSFQLPYVVIMVSCSAVETYQRQTCATAPCDDENLHSFVRARREFFCDNIFITLFQHSQNSPFFTMIERSIGASHTTAIFFTAQTTM